MSFKEKKQGVGKKIRAKPNPVLRNAAQRRLLVLIDNAHEFRAALVELDVKAHAVRAHIAGGALVDDTVFHRRAALMVKRRR